MSRSKLQMTIRRLTWSERREIQERARKHLDRLAKQGYSTRAVIDETGCFGIVLVEDLDSGRRGCLLPGGRIRWVDERMGPGALADAAISGVKIEFA